MKRTCVCNAGGFLGDHEVKPIIRKTPGKAVARTPHGDLS